MNESAALDAWLYGLLSGDSALAAALATLAGDPSHPSAWAGAWHPDEAPESTPHPFGVWSWTFPPDIWAQGGERVAVAPALTIEVIAAGSAFAVLAPVAARLDTLLHGALVTSGPIEVFQCLRQHESRRIGSFQGVRFRRLGGVYALLARST